MPRGYRVAWIVTNLLRRRHLSKQEYFDEFIPDYADPRNRDRQIGRDISAVKDVFEDLHEGKVIYNRLSKRYEVI
ncbi:hypothetical protein EFN45_02925 [Leuconostoc citreum]|uniref:hypothetical protein n=1 Tax=Leuconostoc citreum TaxID=33964 RepID=UPI0021A65EC9|nr:hypothetical protein [Leuconostoc citreum]MCT3069054.1 hypothetical protein [Leuconostoc citreum]